MVDRIYFLVGNKINDYILKSKFLPLAAGVVALLGAGAIGGTALMASAQTATTSNTPVVTAPISVSQSAVDKPETSGDKADGDNPPR